MSAGLAGREASTPLSVEILRTIDRTPRLGYALHHIILSWGQLALLIALVPWLPEGWAWKLLYIGAMGWTQYRLYSAPREAGLDNLLRRSIRPRRGLVQPVQGAGRRRHIPPMNHARLCDILIR